ncbi:lysM domain receptor-like kinase 3 isoform X2 [Bidens hawaiensis]|uniref:lysM domain receptor-like kinase 3 isoform X2 n=1 Tax=Bidens hawaiensis TaxID=980011 RepID=UPI00404AD769
MKNDFSRKYKSLFLFLVLFVTVIRVESRCIDKCLALASYTMWEKSNITFLTQIFSTTIQQIQSYNPQITNPDIVAVGSKTNVPFSCACNDQDFLNHRFVYTVGSGDTYSLIAETYFSGLTNVDMLRRYNNYNEVNLQFGSQVDVIVNCSCGNIHVSKDYGLFITYPIRSGENLSSIANETAVNETLLREYNPGSSFLNKDVVFVPGRDQNGTFPPLKTSTRGSLLYLIIWFTLFLEILIISKSNVKSQLIDVMVYAGLSGGATAGISIGAIACVLFLGICLYFVLYRRKSDAEGSLLLENGPEHLHDAGSGGNMGGTTNSDRLIGGGITGITVDKSVEFTYEELAMATDDFSPTNKIGQGGFGTVYYGELRGEKAAIKKMDMQASKEFLAELKVLTHVHHLNLVRLIGYCVEESLFLVYEFIGNGNLSQHLRGSAGREPIPWATRVQIALDSARGLEYIHEHTVPVYIHRDIKSPNILIDENFRAKVADFGLTKLTEFGSGNSLQTRLVGTFGYMPPEYAQYGEVSPKVDVYAFGVVLFELISAKEAVVKTNEFGNESKGLVGLFDDILSLSDPSDGLRKLVDPRLGSDYPLDSVRKCI